MAFIQPANVQLSMQGGLQSKTDSLQLQPPALLKLQNARFDKLGQLNKRFGYNTLSTEVIGGGSISNAFAIDNFNNELNLFDNKNIYTYIESTQNWANRGTAISLVNTNHQVIRTSAAQQLNPDSGFLNDVEVYAWEDSRGGVRYSVIDAMTNAYIVADKVLYGGGAKPKIVIFNNLFYCFYTDGVSNIYYKTINPNNPNLLSAQRNVAADGYQPNPGDTFTFSYDVTVANSKIFLAYSALDYPTAAIKLFSINEDNTLNTKVVVEADRGKAFSVVGDSQNQIWVSWSNNINEVKTSVYDGVPSTPTLILSPTVIDTINCATLTGIESSINPGTLQLVYEGVGNIPSNQYVTSVVITNTATISLIGILGSVGIASKPFKNGSNIFINLTHQSTLQSTYFMVLLNTAPFTIVGKVSPDLGGGLRTNGMIPEVNVIDSGVFQYSNLVKGSFISENNVTFSLLGVNATTVDFTNVNKFNSVTQSNNLLFVGGILQSYDGVSVAEQNFHIYPEDVLSNIVYDGTGALSAGQYQYQALYAWTDNFGQVQYSTPSPAITVTTSVNASVVLQIPTCRLTAKSNVVIKVYRTLVNQTTFYEVTSELLPLNNNKAANYVTFKDVAADSQITTNETIYTTGGILPNSAPPSCSLISLYQDRVFIAGLEQPNTLWYSKNKFDSSNFNTIPPEFSNALTISVSQLGGPITALGLMDNNLIIFKKNSIFVLNGDGPNDTGGGQGFPNPALVSNSVGCSNPNSVVLSKDGIMFQSDKGIWLLDRGLGAPQFIGAPVDDQTKTQTVSSATVDPNDNLIIFTTYNGDALVYDYYCNQWATWTNHNAVDSLAIHLDAQTTTEASAFAFCKANGVVYVQNRTSFTDDSEPVIMEFITPWMSLAQMLGYQSVFRCFILGQYKSPHQLNVSVGYDFNPSFGPTDSATINATSLAGSNVWGSDTEWGDSSPWGGVFQPYMFQVNFRRITCTSFRLKISDSPTSPYSEGYAISNLNFEVGVMPDGVRLPKTNKVGTR